MTGAEADVVLRDCTLARNRARAKWLGAVVSVIANNRLTMERCRLVEVDAEDASGSGQAIAVSGEAEVVMRDSLVAGGARKGGSLVLLRDAARLLVARSTLVKEGEGYALEALGTTTDRPSVSIADSIVSGGEASRSEMDAAVALDRSVVHGRMAGPVTLGPAVRQTDPAFAGNQPEPYRPSRTSPAAGLARGGGRDLAGRTRPVVGVCAGAFEP